MTKFHSKNNKNQRRKNILFIIQLPPPVHGASMMNSYLINSKKINSNFNVRVINLQFAKSIKELREFSLLKIYKAIIYYFKIFTNIISFNPDLVYFTITPFGFAFYRDCFYVFLLRLFNKKTVFHLHGKGIKKAINGCLFKKYLYQWVFKKTYVICLSPQLINDIDDVYKLNPFIVPNGIQIQPEIKEKKFRKNVSVPQILFLSNYKRAKGILILIEALGILKNKGFNFYARLVGEPGDLSIDFLENMIKGQHLTEVIQVAGPLYGDDKIAEFQNADIFVFPTYYRNEAFPLVILEAFQFSIPVISTYEGGIPDMIINNESGFLVQIQNAEKLAEKIGILLENKDLRIEMGKKGYERYIKNFTLTQFENNMNETFQNILGIK